MIMYTRAGVFIVLMPPRFWLRDGKEGNLYKRKLISSESEKLKTHKIGPAKYLQETYFQYLLYFFSMI
jgi:hypothetical protein